MSSWQQQVLRAVVRVSWAAIHQLPSTYLFPTMPLTICSWRQLGGVWSMDERIAGRSLISLAQLFGEKCDRAGFQPHGARNSATTDYA